jgi:pyridoxal-phosphate dependent enzyme
VIHDDILGTVGRPMCRLGKIVPDTSAEVVAKLEFFEPGGSIKDRAAVSMLDAAERDGRLKPGMPVVEASGGNTGVGLAMACAVRGHPCGHGHGPQLPLHLLRRGVAPPARLRRLKRCTAPGQRRAPRHGS